MENELINDKNVRLRESIVVTKEGLKVAYEIDNQSNEDIYVFDLMFRLAQGPVLDSSLVYTVVEDDLLTLFLGVLRIPEGLQVEIPDVPFARRLPAKETMKSVFKAPIPLPFRQPYEWNDREEMRFTSKIRLRIGYIFEKDLNPRPVMRKIGGVELFSVGYRQTIDVQRFLESQTSEVKMRVLVKP